MTALNCHSCSYSMIQDVLKKLDLTDKEVKVYLALLERGTQPASVIARATDLPRNTARFQLDKLVKKGLVTKTYKGNIQVYSPEHPETLLQVLEVKKKRLMDEIETQQEQIENFLPEFTSFFRKSDVFPKVKFYEGLDNLKTLYEDTLTSETPIVCYSDVDGLLDVFGEDYMDWYTTEKAKRNIELNSIALDTKRTREYVKDNAKKKRDMYLVPAKNMPFTNEINIYDGKMSIIALKDMVGVLIESQDIYISQTTIFKMAWGFAEKIGHEYK
jgi:HTH-type transcriptional regulator, sugar sensing transcriptional regulator